MKVIVTGTLGYDYIMDFSGKFADRIMPDKAHKISLSFLVDSLNKQYGGTAGNIAFNLKLLGVEPSIVSVAGNDFAPYKEFLERHGITTKYIDVRTDLATGSYFVVTDQDDNQIGSFYSGATRYAKALDITHPGKSDIIIISPTDPEAMKRYVQDCKNNKLPYLYDPAFQIGSFSKDELLEGIQSAQILIGNDYEIELIQEKIGTSHQNLLEMVPILITTLGSHGSFIETQDQKLEIIAAKPNEILDPTGAGDAFRGGFIAGFLRKYDLKTCGQMGAIAAVYTVEKYGTITHQYTSQEFIERYKDNFAQNLTL